VSDSVYLCLHASRLTAPWNPEAVVYAPLWMINTSVHRSFSILDAANIYKKMVTQMTNSLLIIWENKAPKHSEWITLLDDLALHVTSPSIITGPNPAIGLSSAVDAEYLLAYQPLLESHGITFHHPHNAFSAISYRMTVKAFELPNAVKKAFMVLRDFGEVVRLKVVDLDGNADVGQPDDDDDDEDNDGRVWRSYDVWFREGDVADAIRLEP
jgi:hypothetical protein